MADDPNAWLDDLDEDEPDRSGLASENLQEVRNYAKRLERKMKKQAKEFEDRTKEFETYKAGLETDKVKEYAKSKGLSEAQIAFLPEFTQEKVDGFIAAFNIKPEGPSEAGSEPGEQETQASPEAPVVSPAGFQPVSGTKVLAQPYTSEDLDKAVQSHDAAAVRKMVEEAVRDPSRLKLKWDHMIPNE